jgi:glycosyltransferase involved in cell wall biosynthesis
VITPVLDGERFIEDAIRSVLRQEYPRFEHVVVDGGSTDGTVEILKRHPHLRWVSEPDRGQSDAMNKGFDLSSGEVVVYLNADDYFEPGAFHAVVPHFQRGARFVVGRVNLAYADGSIVLNDPKVEFEEMLRWWEPNAYCCNAVGYFYLREVQETVGGFNVERPIAMDLEFLLEAGLRFRFTKIDDVLGTFRMLPGTKTVDTAAREPEIMRTICDPYLERFDAEYVERYLWDRDTALRPSRDTGNAGLSAARFATAIRRRTRKIAADLRDRIR